MDSDRPGRWLNLGANLGVITGLVFVALEIKTNTESSRMAIDQNYSANWMAINTSIATNRELADIFERGLAGEDLDRAELRQFTHLVSMYLTQSFHMLRLYDLGLISEQEIRDAFRALREYARPGRFREHVLQIGNERRKNLVLDPEGMDKWLNTVDDDVCLCMKRRTRGSCEALVDWSLLSRPGAGSSRLRGPFRQAPTETRSLRGMTA